MTTPGTATTDAGATPSGARATASGTRSAPATVSAIVTGMGAVTPSGLDVESTWNAVVSGQSAVSLLDGPEFTDLPVRIGGQVRDFDTDAVLPRALARRLAPVQHWAVAAADEALCRAGVLGSAHPPLDPGSSMTPPWDAARFAILIATGSGPISAMQAATRALDSKGPRGVPFALSVYGSPDSVAGLLSERYGARGPSQAVSATCASGAVGLGTGLRWIRHGYADAVLVVGMEDCLGPVNLASNAQMRALASGFESDPEAASRPFDRSRNGFVMSSGAAAVLLESGEAWSARRGGEGGPAAGGGIRAADGSDGANGVMDGGQPLVELAGFGASSDAHHPTAPPPDGHGAAQAVRECLADARTEPEAIDHINAHGTGTPLGDAAELAGLRAALGEVACEIPLTATKSTTGHLLGAAGVLEAVLAIKTMQTGLVPPTINLDDPEFPDWNIVSGEARRSAVRSVLSNSFGFGGHNGAVLLRRWGG